jgi:glycosyltransferase involved in cell wall biosynthesis
MQIVDHNGSTPLTQGIFDRIAIATHYYATGPAFELEEYLRQRTQLLVFIAHPLFPGALPSYFRVYRDGLLSAEGKTPSAKSPGRYLAELTRTLRWTSDAGPHFDLFVGGDSFLALPGVYLRSRGRVERVILYSIDFVPQRFKNPLLNRVYHGVDTFASRHVDVIWNLSEGISRARAERDKRVAVSPQIVVPVGAHMARIPRKGLAHATQGQIAFMGHLLEKQGVQLAIEALPAIRTQVPNATLLILGDGPYASKLKELAHIHGVQNSVRFAGFIESHTEIEELLADSALAVAPYVPDPTSFTRFTDPGKLKTYLACGLPIVLTDVPEFAKTIAAAGAGSIVPYRAEALAAAIVDYLTNPVALDKARVAAATLAQPFEWDRIFDEAFDRTAAFLAPRATS